MTSTSILARASVLGLAMAGALCASAARADEPSPWLVRLRAVQLQSVNHDGTGLDLSIDNKVIPEVDITYLWTPELATELVLTYPQKQTVSAGGTSIGSLKHLPPSLLMQYRFTGIGALGGVTPYVGAGINWTHFSNVNLPAGVDIDRSSFGPALQVGVDVPLQGNLSLNFDVKKVYIATDVSSGGSKLGTFHIDPWLFGVGIGWRF